jgi:diacylglycerol O-acyltransferase
MDRALLRYQSNNPGAAVAGGYVLSLTGNCDVEALRAFVRDRVRRFPALTEHLAHPRGGDRPVWARDPNFDAAEHVREHVLPVGAGPTGLRAFVEEQIRAPIPLETAPWRVYVLREPSPAGTTVFFRSSHVWLDGMAVHRVVDMLFGAADDAGAVPARPLGWDGRPTPAAVLAALADLATWTAPSASPRALACPLAGSVRLHWATTSRKRLRALSRTYRATVNDLFLVALAEALDGWSPTPGRRRPQALMPLSTRRADELHLLSNFVAGARIRLPELGGTPRDRVTAVARQTARYRSGPRSGAGHRWWFERIPTPLMGPVVTSGLAPRRVTMFASNLGVLSAPMAVAGHAIAEALPVPVLVPGQRLSLGLGGRGDSATLSIVADGNVPDIAALAERWLAAVDHLEEAADLPVAIAADAAAS